MLPVNFIPSSGAFPAPNGGRCPVGLLRTLINNVTQLIYGLKLINAVTRIALSMKDDNLRLQMVQTIVETKTV